MTTFDITSLSSKGQVVIPQSLRKELGMGSGMKIVILTDGSNLLLKPLKDSRMTDFQALIKASRSFAKRRKFTQSKLNKIVKQVRNEHRS